MITMMMTIITYCREGAGGGFAAVAVDVGGTPECRPFSVERPMSSHPRRVPGRLDSVHWPAEHLAAPGYRAPSGPTPADVQRRLCPCHLGRSAYLRRRDHQRRCSQTGQKNAVDWLIDWSTDRLTDWLTDWLADWWLFITQLKHWNF